MAPHGSVRSNLSPSYPSLTSNNTSINFDPEMDLPSIETLEDLILEAYNSIQNCDVNVIIPDDIAEKLAQIAELRQKMNPTQYRDISKKIVSLGFEEPDKCTPDEVVEPQWYHLTPPKDTTETITQESQDLVLPPTTALVECNNNQIITAPALAPIVELLPGTNVPTLVAETVNVLELTIEEVKPPFGTTQDRPVWFPKEKESADAAKQKLIRISTPKKVKVKRKVVQNNENAIVLVEGIQQIERGLPIQTPVPKAIVPVLQNEKKKDDDESRETCPGPMSVQDLELEEDRVAANKMNFSGTHKSVDNMLVVKNSEVPDLRGPLSVEDLGIFVKDTDLSRGRRLKSAIDNISSKRTTEDVKSRRTPREEVKAQRTPRVEITSRRTPREAVKSQHAQRDEVRSRRTAQEGGRSQRTSGGLYVEPSRQHTSNRHKSPSRSPAGRTPISQQNPTSGNLPSSQKRTTPTSSSKPSSVKRSVRVSAALEDPASINSSNGPPKSMPGTTRGAHSTAKEAPRSAFGTGRNTPRTALGNALVPSRDNLGNSAHRTLLGNALVPHYQQQNNELSSSHSSLYEMRKDAAQRMKEEKVKREEKARLLAKKQREAARLKLAAAQEQTLRENKERVRRMKEQKRVNFK